MRPKVWRAAVISLLTAGSLAALAPSAAKAAEPGTLEIVFPELTSGDAAIYRGPCGDVGLIDASQSEANREAIADTIRSLGASSLAWIVVSHYDKDHLGNVVSIGKEFSPPVVYDRGGDPRAKNTGAHRVYLDWLAPEAGPRRDAVVPGERISLCSGADEVTFEVEASGGAIEGGTRVDSNKENDLGVCLKISYRAFDMASCGDAESPLEAAVAPLLGDVDFAKVDHHGSRSSSGKTYVKVLQAQAAVILTPQRHDCQPDPEVISRWEARGTVYVTGYGWTKTWGKRCRDWSDVATVGPLTLMTSGEMSFEITTPRSGRTDTFLLDEALQTVATTERSVLVIDSGVLDVVIGVIFVFLVFSLIVSGVGEVINKGFALRSRHLWRTIRKLLDDEGKNLRSDQRPAASPTPSSWTDRLYVHPLIRQLEGRLPTARSRLSTIPATDFSRALIDLIVNGGTATMATVRAAIGELPGGESLKKPLEAIAREAGEELVRFREGVGGWFDARMESLSAAYKRHVRWILLGVAIVVVVIFNVDAIGAANTLHRDEALRTAVSAQAVALSGTCKDKTGSELTSCIQQEVGKVTDSIRLPVGWPDPDGIDAWQVLGWAIAAIAISQGAPFWFDALRKASGLKQG